MLSKCDLGVYKSYVYKSVRIILALPTPYKKNFMLHIFSTLV